MQIKLVVKQEEEQKSSEIDRTLYQTEHTEVLGLTIRLHPGV